MENTRLKVLERQLDDVAGKAKRLEAQMTAVIEVMCRRANTELLQVTSREESRLKFPDSAQGAAYQHRLDRDSEVRSVTREAEIDRLIAERREREREKTPRRG